MKLNLNNPAVMVTSLNGRGVNAPSKTISKPCFENPLVTFIKFSDDKNGIILFVNKKPIKSVKNHPRLHPINPPITEKNAVNRAICHHLLGVAYTQAASRGSVGMGIIKDSNAEKK